MPINPRLIRESHLARKLKNEIHSATVGDVSAHVDALRDELGEEMRSWYDNMSENLQGGDKGSQVDEAASTLEGLDTPDVPDIISDLGFSYSVQHKGGRKGDPRWLRRDNETSALSSAVDAVREWVDSAKTAVAEFEEENPEAEDDAQVELGEQTHTLQELRDGIEEAEQFADDLESLKDEADGVEFPGMYG